MPPVLANYYLTYKCNSRCTYCDIPVKPANIKIKEASAEVIIENLAALKRLGVKVVDFTGGEPLIHPHLPKILKAAKDMGFFTSLANTGTLYPRVANEIKGLVDDLKFSLSTTDPDFYKAERGINGFDKVIESIKLAKSLGEQPSIIATGTPESIWGMEKVIRLAQELGVVVLLGPVFDFCDNALLHDEGIKEIRRLAQFDNVCVNWAFLQFYLDGGNQISKPRCKAVSSVVVISPDDHLLLPCYHMHDERLKIQHENGVSNLDKMWHSPPVQEKKKMEGAWSFCQGCTIWCYFETSFLWPPDKYFFLNMRSKARWGKEKVKQYVESRTKLDLTRRMPGSTSKQLTAISTNPIHSQSDKLISESASPISSQTTNATRSQTSDGLDNATSVASGAGCSSPTVDEHGYTVTPVTIESKK